MADAGGVYAPAPALASAAALSTLLDVRRPASLGVILDAEPALSVVVGRVARTKKLV